MKVLDNLKKATRVSSLNSAKILLTRALDNSSGSLEAIRDHDEHQGSLYANDMLVMNTKTCRKRKIKYGYASGQGTGKKN